MDFFQMGGKDVISPKSEVFPKHYLPIIPEQLCLPWSSFVVPYPYIALSAAFMCTMLSVLTDIKNSTRVLLKSWIFISIEELFVTREHLTVQVENAQNKEYSFKSNFNKFFLTLLLT